jgi:hypothetical protein
MDDQRTDQKGGEMTGVLRYVITAVMLIATIDHGYQAIFEHRLMAGVLAAVYGVIFAYFAWRLVFEQENNSDPTR